MSGREFWQEPKVREIRHAQRQEEEQRTLPLEQSTTLSGIPERRKPGDPPPTPSKSNRPKRRRKGQLNDGEWAPGYGPNAKKK